MEILLFDHTLQISFAFSRSIQALQKLAAVCKPWRDIVRSTPAFWTLIHDRLSPIHRKWCISLSGTSPLIIRLGSFYEEVEPFWDQSVLQHSGRWGEFDAKLHHYDLEEEGGPEYVTNLENGAITLQKFSLHVTTGPGVCIKLNPQGWPLKELRLISRCSIQWDSPRIQAGSLTSLILDDLIQPGAPSLDQLLHTLRFPSPDESKPARYRLVHAFFQYWISRPYQTTQPATVPTYGRPSLIFTSARRKSPRLPRLSSRPDYSQ